MNTQELMERAKRGALTQAELDEIAITLKVSSPNLDLYPLLYAIGRSFAIHHRPVVEHFLDCSEEPDLARLALQILCDFWGDTERYLDEVKRFIFGVPWDEEGEIRLMAISVVGEYLHKYTEPDLLGYVIALFEDRTQDQLVRESAYRALARAVGRDWKDLPSAARHFDLQKDTDSKVLAEARKRLSREKAAGK